VWVVPISSWEWAIFGVDMDVVAHCNQWGICGIVVRKREAIELPCGLVNWVELKHLLVGNGHFWGVFMHIYYGVNFQ